jgi:putative ABC transport system permease protein
MFAYHLQMAWRSQRRTPGLSALMVAAVGLGVGVCMTMLSVYALMSRDPIPRKSDVLYAVQLDNWNPNRPYDEPNEPPPQLTWRDSMALWERSPEGIRRVAMATTNFVIEAVGTGDAKPELPLVRGATADFFAMFDVPFLYGGGWDGLADREAAPVIVLTRETNDRLFGGENSVGRQVRNGDIVLTVVGVTDTWQPTPRYYDLNAGNAFQDLDDVFVPLLLFERNQERWTPSGNINCWQAPPEEGLLHSECVMTQFWVELPDAAAVQDYQAFLDAYVNEQKKLGRFPRPLNNRLSDVNTWLDVNEVVAEDNRVLLGLSFMFLAVCLLNTVGLLLSKFLGRSGDVGVRRALGASRGAIFRQHLTEVGLLGALGGVLGLALAWGGLALVRRLYADYERVATLNVELVAVAIGLAVLAGVLAGLYPAWRICRIPPAVHLKTQ